LLNLKNGSVELKDTNMNYVSFGMGSEILIIIPGLGDSFVTVRGKAIVMAFAYRKFARKYRVYMFSRKNCLEEGYSTRDMARDQVEAMRELGIERANILGVSQGGMISQYIAIDYPNVVKNLVLAVTMSRRNEIVEKVIGSWIEMAKNKDYKSIVLDIAEKSYSEKFLKKYRLIYPVLGIVGKPKDFTRFFIEANSCINHNSYDELDKIKCPTLIIGGDEDKIVGPDASIELSEKIVGSELFMYRGLGHGTYEEAKDFEDRIINFLNLNTN